MSRSKRAPWWTCSYGGVWRKFAKRQASKRIRKLKTMWDCTKNNLYKKFYNSWDIVDFKIYDPNSDKVKRK